MADFATRDPATAAFWDERYRVGFTPWDARGVPPALVQFVEKRSPGPRVLVPGCGSAYEAAFLHDSGFQVVAIDIALEALARAREVLGDELADRVLRQADFFSIEIDVDWIYERALLCALPTRLWNDYARSAERLLRPPGVLAGLFFIDDTAAEEPRRGPPYAARASEIDTLLGTGFECIERQPVPASDSIAVFAGHETWMVWRRRDVSGHTV